MINGVCDVGVGVIGMMVGLGGGGVMMVGRG